MKIMVQVRAPASRMTLRRCWPTIATAALILVLIRDTILRGMNIGSQHDDYPSIISNTPLPTMQQSSTNNNDDYQMAYDESYGFFDDIRTRDWNLLKERVENIQPNKCFGCRGATRPAGPAAAAWFQNHYEPEFTCQHERRIGRLGDGGKWICDPHRIKEAQTEPCLVYSVGSDNDFSFEEHVQEHIGKHCEIHTFDPSNYTQKASEIGVHYHMWGISGAEGKNPRRNWIFHTLQYTIEKLGHVGRTIDIFKIDCEGCELTSYQTWVNHTEAGVMLRQVLVEVHGKGSVPNNQPQIIQEPETTNFFKGMHDNGYVIFHKEPNIHYWRYSPCVEYAFLKLSPQFFNN